MASGYHDATERAYTIASTGTDDLARTSFAVVATACLAAASAVSATSVIIDFTITLVPSFAGINVGSFNGGDGQWG